MLRASALYIVIIIALVIAIICSSLIVTAYLYRFEYQRKFRSDRLQNNLNSGINILLANSDTAYNRRATFALFGTEEDSVSLQKIPWGIYDIGIVKAFMQNDTLYKTFSFANTVDSSKWTVLYLMDEDKPLALSGKSSLVGTTYLPKVGAKAVYMNGTYYQGRDPNLVTGVIHNSQRKLPALLQRRLDYLTNSSKIIKRLDSRLTRQDSLQRSFTNPTSELNLKSNFAELTNVKLSGNIMLKSDTTIVIDSTCSIKNILVFARSIVVKAGFNGTCQLFATDSIIIGKNCRFNYPSSAGILRSDSNISDKPAKIELASNTIFDGTIFTSQATKSPDLLSITLDKGVTISGQIYSSGNIFLGDGTKIYGSIYTKGFLYKNGLVLYDNYVVNSTMNSELLSRYYLTSDLIPVASKRKKILQWLEGN